MSLKKAVLKPTVTKLSEYIVFGYIRKQELLLLIPFIPQIISYRCLAYYFHDLIAAARNDCFRLSHDRLTIQNIQKIALSQHKIYLQHWIQSTERLMITWKFRINEIIIQSGYDISFGIVSKHDNIHCGPQSNDNFVFLYNNGAVAQFNRLIIIPTHLNVFNKGDVISIILDLINQRILYKINNQSEIIMSSNLEKSNNIKYKMALQLGCLGSSVSLEAFYISKSNKRQCLMNND